MPVSSGNELPVLYRDYQYPVDLLAEEKFKIALLLTETVGAVAYEQAVPRLAQRLSYYAHKRGAEKTLYVIYHNAYGFRLVRREPARHLVDLIVQLLDGILYKLAVLRKDVAAVQIF